MTAIHASMSGQSFSSMGMRPSCRDMSMSTDVVRSWHQEASLFDDTDGIGELCAFGYEHACQAIDKLRPLFFSDLAQPFAPYRRIGSKALLTRELD
jgi:hypothetical protein